MPGPVPNRAPKGMFIDVNAARLKAERAALNEASGGFKTGAQANKGTKRARTRSAAKNRAIREDMN
jgi:hypothetical protein